jgi:PAS domain S-box-containing protein
VDQLSPQARRVVSELLNRAKNSKGVIPDGFSVVLSVQGDCLEVSDQFCGLVGYDRASLVGKPLDSVTSPDLINIPKNLGFVVHFGTMQGLWMLRRHDGTQILVRYESELLPNLTIEMRLEPIEVNGQVTGNR